MSEANDLINGINVTDLLEDASLMHNSLFPDELNRQTIAIKEQRYPLWVEGV